jgi:hypothetical protein
MYIKFMTVLVRPYIMLLLAPFLGPPTYSTHSNWLFSKEYLYVACACILRPDKMKLLPVLVRTNYMSWGGGGQVQ